MGEGEHFVLASVKAGEFEWDSQGLANSETSAAGRFQVLPGKLCVRNISVAKVAAAQTKSFATGAMNTVAITSAYEVITITEIFP